LLSGKGDAGTNIAHESLCLENAGRLRMRHFGVSNGSIVAGAILGAFILTFAAAPARASSFTFDSTTNTYTYVGDPFNVCGYGCPEHAPSNPVGADYIIATLTFASPLAPDLTDATPVPTAWTMTDFFDAFSFSGVGVPPDAPPDRPGELPIPGLVLSTDSSGNITQWIMSAWSGGPSSDGYFVGTAAFISNPPIFCGEECGGVGITDALGVNVRSDPDTEWDAFTFVAAPEPGTLTLLGAGLLTVARRLRERRG
jgi:hypothetical protein